MRSGMTWQNKSTCDTSPGRGGRFWLGLALAWLVALAHAVTWALTAGCASTVTPPVAVAWSPSWDGTNLNSGFVCYTTNASGTVTGGIITAHAAARYNALMSTYGGTWQAKPADGLTELTNGLFAIDAQHLSYFTTANRWRKNGLTTAPK